MSHWFVVLVYVFSSCSCGRAVCLFAAKVRLLKQPVPSSFLYCNISGLELRSTARPAEVHLQLRDLFFSSFSCQLSSVSSRHGVSTGSGYTIRVHALLLPCQWVLSVGTPDTSSMPHAFMILKLNMMIQMETFGLIASKPLVRSAPLLLLEASGGCSDNGCEWEKWSRRHRKNRLCYEV